MYVYMILMISSQVRKQVLKNASVFTQCFIQYTLCFWYIMLHTIFTVRIYQIKLPSSNKQQKQNCHIRKNYEIYNRS